MDKKSKILLAVVLVAIAISVGITYWKTMVKRDYMVEAQTDCDPYEKPCFVYLCDPEWEECTGDLIEDTWYYKIVRRNAANIPDCDPEADETCDPWTCNPGEAECEEILCDDELAAELETECTDPEQYALEFPYECDPEVDEDCEAEEELCDEETGEGCEEESDEIEEEGVEEGDETEEISEDDEISEDVEDENEDTDSEEDSEEEIGGEETEDKEIPSL